WPPSFLLAIALCLVLIPFVLWIESGVTSASRRTHSLPRSISGHEIRSYRDSLLRGRGDCSCRAQLWMAPGGRYGPHQPSEQSLYLPDARLRLATPIALRRISYPRRRSRLIRNLLNESMQAKGRAKGRDAVRKGMANAKEERPPPRTARPRASHGRTAH